MKNLFLCAVACAAFALPTWAQPRVAPGNGGVFSLPPGVTNMVAIDAHNTLLVETEDADGATRISVMPVRHLYAGGVSRLFGGSVMPTLPFISPGNFNGGGIGVTVANGANGASNNAFGNDNSGVGAGIGAFGGNAFGAGATGAVSAFGLNRGGVTSVRAAQIRGLGGGAR